MTVCFIRAAVVAGESSGLRPSDASRHREAILLLALAGFNAGISLRCVEPMLPKLAVEFDSSVSAAASVMTAFAFAYAGAVLVQGPLGDRFGKLRVVTLAMALSGAACIGCAFAWSLGSLAAPRFVTAFFASASVAARLECHRDALP